MLKELAKISAGMLFAHGYLTDRATLRRLAPRRAAEDGPASPGESRPQPGAREASTGTLRPRQPGPGQRAA